MTLYSRNPSSMTIFYSTVDFINVICHQNDISDSTYSKANCWLASCQFKIVENIVKCDTFLNWHLILHVNRKKSILLEFEQKKCWFMLLSFSALIFQTLWLLTPSQKKCDTAWFFFSTLWPEANVFLILTRLRIRKMLDIIHKVID